MLRSLTLSDKVYVGIDPGAKGAIAILQDDEVVIDDMYSLEDAINLFRIQRPFDCRVAIEQVHPLPGQSCIASFTYGENFLLAKLIGMWYSTSPVFVSPQRWKKYFGLKKETGETKTEYKRKSVMKAIDLFPKAKDMLKISKDGRAEALLIAKWLKDTDENE